MENVHDARGGADDVETKNPKGYYALDRGQQQGAAHIRSSPGGEDNYRP